MATPSGSPPGYWSSPWPGEDGGPQRRQVPHGGAAPSLRSGGRLTCTSRALSAPTMVLLRAPGEVFVQGCVLGADSTAWVERVDPESLATLARSPDLPGGPFWPGGMVAHANGSLYVTFGRWCHRLEPDCSVLVARELPRARPYNSLVVFPDGHLVMKDFDLSMQEPAQLLVLEPEQLEIVDRIDAPEASIARISADGNDVYVVGVRAVHRFTWDGARSRLQRDEQWHPVYCTFDGQGYGWDPVLTDDGVWFLDDGEGSEHFGGWFRGKGVATSPLHLVRVDARDASRVSYHEVCGAPGGIIANPPVYDATRRIAVGYDSGNGVMTAFDVDGATVHERWRRPQDHAAHMVLWPETGELLTFDFVDGVDHAVVVDVETGEELGRVATGSPVQSVLFPAPGWSRDAYYASFTTLARVAVEA
jgi:hypothetical protein